VISKADVEARGLRQNWLGPCHYLLAVLAEPSTATDAMAGLGVTHDRLAKGVAAMSIVNGKRVRFVKSRGTTPNPAAYAVRGWADGFAAASGRQRPSPEDWLLATIYRNNDMVIAVLRQLGVSAAEIIEALRRRGVKVPDFEPAVDPPWRGDDRMVEVAKSEWRAVVDALHEKHPAGSEWRWGFNSRRDRPGKIQFIAEEGIDLEAIVAGALAEKKKLED
jgi:ATP-dependent Clp protease ATP-binding subunit ClpA